MGSVDDSNTWRKEVIKGEGQEGSESGQSEQVGLLS